MADHDFVIIGGGPAGLAAGHTGSKQGRATLVLEAENQVGGLSKTIEYKKYYFDIGGHRFLTKIQPVRDLWKEILPDDFVGRERLSRIFYKNQFFHYPLRVNEAMFGLDIKEVAWIIASFIKWRLVPKNNEKSFEDWVSNRFGYGLYSIFFKSYTEKVWGIPCKELSADWAAQRIQKLSLAKAALDAFGLGKKKDIKTLSDIYDYPRLGPGQMYQAMAKAINAYGSEVLTGHRAGKVEHENNKVKYVTANTAHGKVEIKTRALISTMPIDELVMIMAPAAPPEVINAAKELKYRSIITANFIVDQKTITPDNWIYLPSPEIKAGRLQLYKNWSPDMVPDKNMSTIGLEYFSSPGDFLHNSLDREVLEIGKEDLEKLGMVKRRKIKDGFVARYEKAYPVYDVGYMKNLRIIKDYLGSITNLSCAGRYGQFRYNNMDHSILTGILAVKKLSGEDVDPWDVNTEKDYLEK